MELKDLGARERGGGGSEEPFSSVTSLLLSIEGDWCHRSGSIKQLQTLICLYSEAISMHAQQL